MLDELLAIAEDADDDVGIGVVCECVRFGSRCTWLEVELSVVDGEKPRSPESRWQLRVEGLLDYRAEFGGQQLGMRTDHPLLLPYQDDHAYLGFNGECINVEATIGALWMAHQEVTGGWFPLEKFINSYGVERLLRGRFGQFASGPISLVRVYARVLRSAGIDVLLSQGRRPMRYDGNKWVVRTGEEKVLFLGQGYIVAERFSATRLFE